MCLFQSDNNHNLKEPQNLDDLSNQNHKEPQNLDELNKLPLTPKQMEEPSPRTDEKKNE
jgi:hypothetical protein